MLLAVWCIWVVSSVIAPSVPTPSNQHLTVPPGRGMPRIVPTNPLELPIHRSLSSQVTEINPNRIPHLFRPIVEANKDHLQLVRLEIVVLEAEPSSAIHGVGGIPMNVFNFGESLVLFFQAVLTNTLAATLDEIKITREGIPMFGHFFDYAGNWLHTTGDTTSGRANAHLINYLSFIEHSDPCIRFLAYFTTIRDHQGLRKVLSVREKFKFKNGAIMADELTSVLLRIHDTTVGPIVKQTTIELYKKDPKKPNDVGSSLENHYLSKIVFNTGKKLFKKVIEPPLGVNELAELPKSRDDHLCEIAVSLNHMSSSLLRYLTSAFEDQGYIDYYVNGPAETKSSKQDPFPYKMDYPILKCLGFFLPGEILVNPSKEFQRHIPVEPITNEKATDITSSSATVSFEGDCLALFFTGLNDTQSEDVVSLTLSLSPHFRAQLFTNLAKDTAYGEYTAVIGNNTISPNVVTSFRTAK